MSDRAPATASLFAYLDDSLPDQLALLEQLVNLDSSTFDKAGVDAVGRLLTAELHALGLATEVVARVGCGDHVVGRKPGQRTALLVGHMDTVFPTGTPAARPFRVEAGRAHGPGVYDMKGGLVVLIFALRALARHAPAAWARLGLRVVFNADEETGSATSHDLIAAEADQSQAACVLEPARPGGEYVSQRKGVGDFTLRVEGRAAHAGTQPERGVNAIADLAARVSRLHALTDLASGLTVNVGVIRGGERPNVVPALAECELDVRVTSRAQIASFEAALAEVVKAVHVPGARATVEGGFAHHPMELTPGSRRLFEVLARATAEVGFETRHLATGGASDGNTTARHVPTLDGMGPRGNFAHSPDEYVEVASLPERAKALARFLDLWVAEP